MTEDRRHQRFLRFIARIVDVPGGYSKDDLFAFRNVASRNYPLLVPLIDDYLRLAEESDVDVPPFSNRDSLLPGLSKRQKQSSKHDQMHLFDMLREKKLFPSNALLSDFAGRVLPNMNRNRFEKMSRGDIATRIIEYLETLDRRTREKLEASMREAMVAGPRKPSERKSFLSEWEKIIKGIPL